MELSGYLDFLDPLDIRIQGTRIGLEDVVYAFRQGWTPDDIAAHYRSLTLEQVYAVLAYYLRNRAQVDDYVARLEAWQTERRRESSQNFSPVVQRLREAQAVYRMEFEPQSKERQGFLACA